MVGTQYEFFLIFPRFMLQKQRTVNARDVRLTSRGTSSYGCWLVPKKGPKRKEEVGMTSHCFYVLEQSPSNESCCLCLVL